MISRSKNNFAPLITVAIPVFEGAEYVGAAIDSVLAQTFKNFELLIVDNHSCDTTANIVLSYSDDRIRFIQNEENIGAEKNWNKCLSLAKGKYIKILPHDDILEPTCLEEQAKVLDCDFEERIALVFCARNIIDKSGKLVLARPILGLKNGQISSQKLVKKTIRYGANLVGEPGAVLFRLKDVKMAGGFNGQIPYVIDLDCWVRLLARGDAYFIGKYLCSFRISNQSWSLKIAVKQSEQFKKFIKQVFAKSPYKISILDYLFGRLNADINQMARRFLYWFLIR